MNRLFKIVLRQRFPDEIEIGDILLNNGSQLRILGEVLDLQIIGEGKASFRLRDPGTGDFWHEVVYAHHFSGTYYVLTIEKRE